MIYILKVSGAAPSATQWVGRWKGPFMTLADAASEVPDAFDAIRQYGYHIVRGL